MGRWIIAPRGVVEIGPVPELYVDGIGAVELTGNNLRFHLFSKNETFEEQATTQRIIVARIITPRDIVPVAIGQLAHCLITSPQDEIASPPPKPYIVK